MSIPSNISRQDLVKAIHRIKQEGIPSQADSQYYDVLFEGRQYPPKLIVSYANKFANGTELDRNSFNGGIDTPAFRLLEKHGFEIIPKDSHKMSTVQIFLAPRSGEQSSNNFEKTIEGGYQKIDLNKYLTAQDRAALKDYDTLYIWGNRPGNKTSWGKMNPGDYVFFYQRGKIIWVGKLLYKTHNKSLADSLWGPYEYKSTKESWEYVYFLKDMQNVEIDYGVIRDSAGYKPNHVVQGFQPLNQTGIQTILKRYGSIEAFIAQNSKKRGMAKSQHQTTDQIESNLRSLIAAIRTKPFILLAGISGTGKSRMVRTLAFRTCSGSNLRGDKRKPGNFELIPVRPNWHDSTELLGYVTRIGGKEKYIITDFLRFLVKAWDHTDIPFFLCLDEMNLAPVEQYFAEYLSIVETRNNHSENGEVVTDALLSEKKLDNPAIYEQLLSDLNIKRNSALWQQFYSSGISLPPNLVVMGTVNMDETTHSFSRKVLDRAMTFEMNEVNLSSGLDHNDSDWTYESQPIAAELLLGKLTNGGQAYSQLSEGKEFVEFLEGLNKKLDGTPFKIAYRVRDEFLIYCYYSSSLSRENTNWLTTALDELTCMKILSRIEGDENKAGDVLSNLRLHLGNRFPKSQAKLQEMINRLEKSGYTSFWS